MVHNETIVCIRKKPCIENEPDIIDANNNSIRITGNVIGARLTNYEYDYVFNEKTKTNIIYTEVFERYIKELFSGKSLICYLCGHSGTGKSFTLFGDKKNPGLLQLSVNGIMNTKSNSLLRVSAFELDNNRIFDLLRNKRVYPKQNESYLEIIKSIYDTNITELNKKIILESISNNRHSRNSKRSSKVYTIITLNLSHRGSNTKMIFVDLAGSEKHIDRAVTLDNDLPRNNNNIYTLKDSLRLDKKLDSRCYNFRSSRLMDILSETFSRNFNTIIIGTVDPEPKQVANTIKTLSYVSDFKKMNPGRRFESNDNINEYLGGEKSILPYFSRNNSIGMNNKNTPRIKQHPTPDADMMRRVYGNYIKQMNATFLEELRLLEELMKQDMNPEDTREKIRQAMNNKRKKINKFYHKI